MALREKLQVMVVDDTTTGRSLISQALESIGISRVSTAPDARAAYSMMLQNPVHLAICDYMMPDMNGLELLRAIRMSPQTKRIGFILVTGRPSPEMMEAGQKLGMNNFLAKPFNAAALQSSIEQVVGRI